MINLTVALFLFAFGSQRHTLRRVLIPTQSLRSRCQSRFRINLTSCTNQGVTVYKLRTKPRYKTTLIYRVQPQRNLRQLHCNRVQVDTVNIAVGYEHFYLLQFLKTVFITDDFAGFLFLFGNIRFGQLIDGLIQEGCGTHGRLAHSQMENFISGFVFQELLQGILNQTLCKNLRRVVGCGLFPLSACQAINESAFFIHTELALLLAGFIAHTLLFRVLVKLRFRYKVANIQLIETVTGALYFVKIVFSNKATIGKQCFVNCAHLVDTKICI